MKAIEIIRRSMRLIGALGVGEAPTSEESKDCLNAMNQLIASWNVNAPDIYAVKNLRIPLVGGQTNYTIGPLGDLDIPRRPDKIFRAFLSSNTDSIEINVQMSSVTLTNTQFNRFTYASVFYNPTFPLGQILLMNPEQPYDNLDIIVFHDIGEIANIDDDLLAPPQYYRALSYNLAMEIAPEFGLNPSASLVNSARESLGMLRKMNSRPITSVIESSMVSASWWSGTGGKL